MQIKQYLKNIFRTSRWKRRFSVRRMVMEMTGLMVGLEAITVIILQLVSEQRKQRRPEGGFPHPYLDEVRVGDNTLQIYDYGRDLYDAMLAAISAIKLSEMIPGPLGISETRPMANAPYEMASCASWMLLMQQIFTCGFWVGFM